MNKRTSGIAAIALVIGFAGGYFMHSSPTGMQNARGNFTAPAGMGLTGARAGGFGAGAGAGFLSGTVAAKDATSITLNTRDGSSHVVLINPSTMVSKSAAGSLADVSIGSTVMVTGTTTTSGSLIANLIQLRPMMPQIGVQN